MNTVQSSCQQQPEAYMQDNIQPPKPALSRTRTQVLLLPHTALLATMLASGCRFSNKLVVCQRIYIMFANDCEVTAG